MKKWLKIILTIVGIFVLCIALDIVSIYTRNKPIFAVKDDCDCADQIYYGLFYNTYNCLEYPTPKIVSKGSKYTCSKTNNENVIFGKIIEIKDSYFVIESTTNTIYIKTGEKAQISLSNNPVIKGANNIILGQKVKIIPKNIQEIYPINVETDLILIINNSNKIIDIVDNTETCDQAIEKFYEDDLYEYYFSCIKSDYIIVKYENGYQETIKSSFEYGDVNISDLDKYNIKYIKESKE